MSGTLPPPAEGVRCDVTFEGPVAGPKLRGTVRGTDYGYLRADGRAGLHIHGMITTDDGKNISLAADGVASINPESPAGQLRENVTLTTSEPGYTWLNTIQIWATGSVEFANGTLHVTAYAASERLPRASDGRPCPGFPAGHNNGRRFIPKRIPSKMP